MKNIYIKKKNILNIAWLALFIFFVICTPAIAEDPAATIDPIHGKNLIRVYLDDKDPAQLLAMDIASVSKGHYLDIVATQTEIDTIQNLGFRIVILPVNASNLFEKGTLEYSYHTYASMLAELQDIETQYPSIAKLHDIGDSVEGRDIWALKISDNVHGEETEKKFFIVGNHHAREIMTPEIPLYQINYLVSEYGNDPAVTAIVDSWELWFVPMTNPDGHINVENGDIWWRKNRRLNGDGTIGVDLNRNYGYTWGYDDVGSSPIPDSQTYRGTAAFSEPESQAIRDLLESKPFDYVFDYHSYGEMILYPWGHITSPTPDDDVFKDLSQEIKTILPSYISGQPYELLYRVNGDSMDWEYGEQTEKSKIIAITFEVNTSSEGGFRPPASKIQPTCEKHLQVLLKILEDESTYTLTVVNGSGDGDYAQDARVSISADSPAPKKRFKEWVGAVQYLDNPTQANTTVTMPAQNITVSATYEDIPPLYNIYLWGSTVIDDWSGESRLGNGDTVFNPSERIELEILLRKTGDDARDVTATLSTSDPNEPYVIVPQGFETVNYPDILSGEEKVGLTNFVIQATDDPVVPRHGIRTVSFNLLVTANGGSQAEIGFNLYMRNRPFVVDRYSIPDGKRVDLGDVAGANNSFRARTVSTNGGHVYAVYGDERNGSYDIYFNSSEDFGVSWQDSDIRLDTTPAGSSNSYGAEIACDESGNVYVVWVDERSGEKDIYFNYSDDYGRPGSWQTGDMRIDRNNPTFGWSDNPRISCDENRNVYVIWTDFRYGNWDVYFNYSSEKGTSGTWLANDIRLNTNAAGSSNSGYASVANDNSGNVYVTWRDTRSDNGDIYLNYSHDYGAPDTWRTLDRRINRSNTADGWSKKPVMACDDNGYVYVAWINDQDIYFNYSSNRGEKWQSQDIKITSVTNTHPPTEIDIDSDESGNIYLVWVAWGSFDKYRVYFDSSKDFGATWRDTDVTIDNIWPVGNSSEPNISCGNNGKVYIAWWEDQERIHMNYTEDRGDTWRGHKLLKIEDGREIGSYPSLDGDAAGNAYIIWQAQDIYCVAVDAFMNDFPGLDVISEKTVNEEEPLRFSVTGRFPSEVELFYDIEDLSQDRQGKMQNASLSNEAYNAQANETVSTFNWTPPAASVGEYSPVYFVARAPSGRCDYKDVRFTVKNSYTLIVVNGEGDGTFAEGTVSPIVADDPIGYIFKNWTGDIGTVGNANAVSTTITMLDNYVVTGNTVKLGDVDGDAGHRVTMTDAIQGAEYSIGLREFTDDQILAANVDGVTNGRNGVSMTDAIIISEYALGLRDSWPIEE